MQTFSEATGLQVLLDNLITNSIVSKHLHWVVRGSSFMQTHKLLDEITDVLRDSADLVAERMAYLGIAPDPYGNDDPYGTDAELPYGFLREDRVHLIMAEALDDVSAVLDDLYELDFDLATEDILVGIQRELDKYQWFFRSHI